MRHLNIEFLLHSATLLLSASALSVTTNTQTLEEAVATVQKRHETLL